MSVLLLFSPISPLFQWGQRLPSCIVFGCQETKKRVFYGQTSWHKNPFLPILLILWAPQVPRQFCSPIHWEVWLEITRTGSFSQMTPACPLNKLLERKAGLSTGFPSPTLYLFLHEKWGAAVPVTVPAHWVQRDIADYNMWLPGLCPCWLFCELMCSCLRNYIIKERMNSFYCLKHESFLNASNLKPLCTSRDQNYAKWW